MNYYERHLGDYARDTAHLTMMEHGAYSLLLDRYYATEAGIPADQVHRVARARTKEEKAAVDAVLAEFFVLESGLWRSKRCDLEIERFRESEPDRAAKRENEKERQRRSRERRKAIFDTLREHGIIPAYDTPMSELQTQLSRVTKHSVTQPVTRDATATQTPDTRHQTPDKTNQVDTHTQYPPPEGVCVSPIAECCKALVNAGIPATSINQGHPKLLALVEAGATVIEFGETARECVGKGNSGFAYVLGTMTRRREQAAATKLHRGAMPSKPTPGQRTADAAQRWLESQTTGESHDALGQS